ERTSASCRSWVSVGGITPFQIGYPATKDSPKATTAAPWSAACAVKVATFATVASASRNAAAACTAATLTWGNCISCLLDSVHIFRHRTGPRTITGRRQFGDDAR